MSHTPHELVDEFPEQREKLHELKVGNPHFAKLADEYHAVNREVHRMETRVEAVDELTEHATRKRRLQLKDEIAAMLNSA